MIELTEQKIKKTNAVTAFLFVGARKRMSLIIISSILIIDEQPPKDLGNYFTLPPRGVN